MKSEPTLRLIVKDKKSKGFALYTYNSTWVPAVTDENGNVIKKGWSRTCCVRKAGEIADNKRNGLIIFEPWFIKEYPELVNYKVYREGKKNIFVPIDGNTKHD